jgi:hypothetical protein
MRGLEATEDESGFGNTHLQSTQNPINLANSKVGIDYRRMVDITSVQEALGQFSRVGTRVAQAFPVASNDVVV